jgi:hypothetical protein
MSACHLLLGRLWQYDIDATHGGHSKNYTFAHKGVRHVLKPMPESAIKVDIFPAVRKKKKDPPIVITKPRTALIQGKKNDAAVKGIKISASSSDIICKDSTSSSIKVGSIFVSLKEKNGNIFSDVMVSKYTSIGGKFKANHSNTASVHKRKMTDTLSKPRTALIQGRENDEPMNHQLDNTSAAISCKKINIGFNLCNNEKNKDERSSVQIGSMLLTIEKPIDLIKVFQGLPGVCKTSFSHYTGSQSNPITKPPDMEIPIQFGHGSVQPDMSILS